MAGLFGGVDQKDFDSFKGEILRKIGALEQQVASKITDSEASARASADNAILSAQSANEKAAKINDIFIGLDSFRNSIKTQLDKISADEAALNQRISAISAETETFRANYDAIVELKKLSIGAHEDVKRSVSEISALADQSKKLGSELEQANGKVAEVQKLRMDMDALLSHSMKRKADIDGLYNSIYGHEVKNQSGEAEHIDGLKDALEKSYQVVSDDVKGIEKKLDELTSETIGKFDIKLNDSVGRFDAVIDGSRSKISAVSAELDNLLPGAMAAGLSAAYEKKALEESASQVILEDRFRNAIVALVAVSLIPFFVDFNLLVQEHKAIVEVIKGTPNLILAILPLYFPVLWFAYSTGKKLNLAKRLIEEYTHKSALGKTFAGLSKQIEALSENDDVKKELRVNLLFNFLQVSSENPGKLITNYDKADHPLMEALENSSKLSSSVDALAKLPGFGVLAKRLADRAEKILETEAAKVQAGLEFQAAIKPVVDAVDA